MTIRDHAIVFWGMTKRWPRATTIVLGGMAIFYFLYYAGIEALPIPDSLAAALGMVLMCVALKTTALFVFYRLFHFGAFEGSFLILATLAAVPFMVAIAIALLLVQQQSQLPVPPPGDVPFMLVGAAVFFTLTLGSAARLFYWVGGGGLKRR